MAEKLVTLVTGANTGLGFEIVKKLLESSQPYEVIVAARSFDKANSAIAALPKSSTSSVSPLVVDLESDETIHKAAADVQAKYGKLDVLINNAGSQFDAKIRDGALSNDEIREGFMSTRAAWNKTWDINVTGTHIMTQAFAPLLIKSSSPCVVFMTSGLSTMAEAIDPPKPTHRAYTSPPEGWPKPMMGFGFVSYRSAKAGLNMMFVEWSRILRKDGVRVACVSPGLLATNLGGTSPEAKLKNGAILPSIGAGVVVDVVEGKREGELNNVVKLGGIQPF